MIINNPTKIIKVPTGSFKIANKSGCLKDYMVYLKLKSFNIEGAFLRGSMNTVADCLGYSIAMFRNYLKRLSRLGWLIKDKTSYQLIGYNALWKRFGYSFKKQEKGLIGSKILKIETKNLDQLENEIIVQELKCNFEAQEKEVLRKHVEQYVPKNADTDKNVRKMRKQLISRFNRMKWLSYQLISIRRNNRLFNSVNYDINVSCQSIANMFGYKSAMQGHKMEQRLMNSGYIKVANRKLLIAKNVSADAFKALCLPSNYLHLSGNIYRQLVNEISFL